MNWIFIVTIINLSGNISRPPLLLSLACPPLWGWQSPGGEQPPLPHLALRSSGEDLDTARLGVGLKARCPPGSQVHMHWGRSGGRKKRDRNRERPVPRGDRGRLLVRLGPQGQQPPGTSTSSFGGRRAGLGWAGRGGRRLRRAGLPAAPMGFGAGPRLRPVPAARSAAEEAARPGQRRRCAPRGEAECAKLAPGRAMVAGSRGLLALLFVVSAPRRLQAGELGEWRAGGGAGRAGPGGTRRGRKWVTACSPRGPALSGGRRLEYKISYEIPIVPPPNSSFPARPEKQLDTSRVPSAFPAAGLTLLPDFLTPPAP